MFSSGSSGRGSVHVCVNTNIYIVVLLSHKDLRTKYYAQFIVCLLFIVLITISSVVAYVYNVHVYVAMVILLFILWNESIFSALKHNTCSTCGDVDVGE